MSFAGKVTRGQTIGQQRATSSSGRTRKAPEGTSIARAGEHAEIDWQQVAIFATGLAIGLMAGAGAALLVAPRSGRDTRRAIVRRGRRLRSRTHDAWDDLRDDLRQELRDVARRSRRSMRAILRRRERQDDEGQELSA